jgi:uncharacterized RDD family membrane protein YckC
MTLEDGRLAVLTPEGVRITLCPAGPPKRALAWLIDSFVWGTLVALAATLTDRMGQLGTGLFFFLLCFIFWGYPVCCEVWFGGRTLGKQVAGLEVVQQDGRPVGWRASITRNLLSVVDFLPLAFAAGLLAMLSDVQFRRLGDLVAGTIVVHRQRPPMRNQPPDAAPQPLPWPLSPAQQRMLIDLVERAPSLPAARVQELADLAAPLTGTRGAASLERLRAMAAGLVRGEGHR